MFNFNKIKERRQKQKDYIRNEIKSIVREAMDEWTRECSYLTQNEGKGRYYCSKQDCEGVEFNDN